MRTVRKLLSNLIWPCLLLAWMFAACATTPSRPGVERIVIAPDGVSFITERSRQPFVPWGVNYGNQGRLMEDFWEEEWETISDDFREIKALGGNVVRIHLQVGKFMEGPNQPNSSALDKLEDILALAEATGLYLDVTGLACYRPSDVPAWYDQLDDAARWQAQAGFWRAVAERCAGHSAVFCYDLMNEPISPAAQKDKWYSGNLFGGYDFVQYIARDPGGRSRGEIAIAWIQSLTAAIRQVDSKTPITVGLLPWVTGWKHLSGFVPVEIAPYLDFISVHIYPKTDHPEEARTALEVCEAGKPVVIEETFPLHCGVAQLESFLRSSREIACGWLWHYDGITPAEYNALEAEQKLTLPQGIWRNALQVFVRLGPEFKYSAQRSAAD